jgi:hypothetical protein
MSKPLSGWAERVQESSTPSSGCTGSSEFSFSRLVLERALKLGTWTQGDHIIEMDIQVAGTSSDRSKHFPEP